MNASNCVLAVQMRVGIDLHPSLCLVLRSTSCTDCRAVLAGYSPRRQAKEASGWQLYPRENNFGAPGSICRVP